MVWVAKSLLGWDDFLSLGRIGKKKGNTKANRVTMKLYRVHSKRTTILRLLVIFRGCSGYFFVENSA